MKNAIVLIGFVAAGFVGALGAIALQPAPETPLAAPGADGLESRLSEVESRVARLSDEVRELRMTPLPEPAAAPAASVAEAAAPEDATASETAAAIPEEELREKVTDILEERAKADREERAKRWAEREVAMLDRLAERLGLNSYQKEELGKILGERRKAMEELRRGIEDGGANTDRDALRAKYREIRESTAEQVKALLTPEQYESFTRQDRGFGGPDRGPGRGGRGPGGRSGGGRGR